MSTAPEVDGSEDVNDFLLRIKALGEQRDKEDEERTRKLEDQILQGRIERKARRAGELSIGTPHMQLLTDAHFCCHKHRTGKVNFSN